MFEVHVESTISCAHRLFGYDGRCEALLGRNYRIEVSYAGSEMDTFGMLADFTIVKRSLDSVLGALDHACLNDLEAFKEVAVGGEYCGVCLSIPERGGDSTR